MKDIPHNSNIQSSAANAEKILIYENKDAELFFMDDIQWVDNYKRGVYCQACHHFTLRQNYKTVICTKCSMCEKKGECIARLTHEYCTIFLEPTVTVRDISEFGGDFFTPRQINKQIASILKISNKGRYARYYNPILNN